MIIRCILTRKIIMIYITIRNYICHLSSTIYFLESMELEIRESIDEHHAESTIVVRSSGCYHTRVTTIEALYWCFTACDVSETVCLYSQCQPVLSVTPCSHKEKSVINPSISRSLSLFSPCSSIYFIMLTTTSVIFWYEVVRCYENFIRTMNTDGFILQHQDTSGHGDMG